MPVPGSPERAGGRVPDDSDESTTAWGAVVDALRWHGRQQAIVAELGRAALGTADDHALLELGVRLAAEGLDVPLTAVIERGHDELAMVTGTGWDPDRLGTRSLPAGTTTLAGYTLEQDTEVVSRDVRADPRFHCHPVLEAHAVVSAVNVLIRSADAPVGVLGAYTTDTREFSDDDVQFLCGIANVLAVARTRARVEATLRERDVETRLAFGTGRMGAWRWSSTTRRGTWSPELEALVGLAPGSFDGTWEAFIGPILAEDGPMMRESIGKAVAAQCEFAVQYRVRRTDGGIRWVESRGTPIAGGAEWIGVTIDVTEERAALEALRESRAELEETVARLDSLLEQAPVGFAFFDRDLRYVRVNPSLAAMHGVAAEAHLGRTVDEVLPGFAPSIGPRLDHILASHEAAADVEVSGHLAGRPGEVRRWLASYYPVPGADGSPLGIGAVVLDVTERRRRERDMRLAAAASDLLASDEEDLGTILQRAADLVVPDLADSCIVSLVPHDDLSHRGAVAHVDPSLAARMREAEVRYPLDVEALVDAAGTGLQGALLVPEVTPDMWSRSVDTPEYRQLAADHAARSVILAPLRAGGRLLGALVLATTPASGRTYRQDDVPFVEELAGRLALVIHGAYLAEEARAAHARLDVLAGIGELLMVDLDSVARLPAFADVTVPAFADVCAIHLADHGVLRVAAFAAADPEVRRALGGRSTWPEQRVDDDTPVARAFRAVAPEVRDAVGAVDLDGWLPEPAARLVAAPSQDAAGPCSELFVPLVGSDGPFGVVGFCATGNDARYRPRDVSLGLEIARRMGPGLENALRFEREAATVEALQRSLLPERLPDLGSARLAARYVPSGAGARIGGDWYDAIPVADGRAVLAIGDVVGHGVRAAASMGRLRNILQFCALEGLDPAESLERLSAYLAALAGSDMATVLVVEHDPSAGRLRFANAGHPPGLVVHPEGAVELLDQPHGMPLGASEGARYALGEVRMEPGSLLVLFTDGLVERRGESLDAGLERLAEVVRTLPDDLDQIADGLLAGLLHHDRSTEDDVAVLLMRTLAPGDSLDLRLAASPRELARLRRQLGEWLRRASTTEEEVAELTLAVNEVAANAVEHAYGLVDAEFLLHGRIEDGEVEVQVRDFGRWRHRRSRRDRGRGLDLARQLVDSLDVVPARSGTTVTLRRRVGGT